MSSKVDFTVTKGDTATIVCTALFGGSPVDLSLANRTAWLTVKNSASDTNGNAAIRVEHDPSNPLADLTQGKCVFELFSVSTGGTGIGQDGTDIEAKKYLYDSEWQDTTDPVQPEVHTFLSGNFTVSAEIGFLS
jgi:hypothetical protein